MNILGGGNGSIKVKVETDTSLSNRVMAGLCYCRTGGRERWARDRSWRILCDCSSQTIYGKELKKFFFFKFQPQATI